MVVLGISLGTRIIGIAVMDNNELIEYRIKTFKGKWNSEKQQNILALFDMLIAYYGVNHLAIKTAHPLRSSKALEQLIAAVVASAQKEQVLITKYTLYELRKKLQLHKQQSVMEYVADKYLVVQKEYRKERNRLYSYYAKMFEAIAVAEIKN